MHLRKQGFTMVELMVSMVAAAILALAVIVVFVMPVKTMRTNNEFTRLKRDMAYAVRIMTDDIHESSVRYDDLPGIITGDNILELFPNRLDELAGTSETVKYERDAGEGSLYHYVNDVSQGRVILEGLSTFGSELEINAEGAVSGVILYMELGNSSGRIAITNETFVHMRN